MGSAFPFGSRTKNWTLGSAPSPPLPPGRPCWCGDTGIGRKNGVCVDTTALDTSSSCEPKKRPELFTLGLKGGRDGRRVVGGAGVVVLLDCSRCLIAFEGDDAGLSASAAVLAVVAVVARPLLIFLLMAAINSFLRPSLLLLVSVPLIVLVSVVGFLFGELLSGGGAEVVVAEGLSCGPKVDAAAGFVDVVGGGVSDDGAADDVVEGVRCVVRDLIVALSLSLVTVDAVVEVELAVEVVVVGRFLAVAVVASGVGEGAELDAGVVELLLRPDGDEGEAAVVDDAFCCCCCCFCLLAAACNGRLFRFLFLRRLNLSSPGDGGDGLGLFSGPAGVRRRTCPSWPWL